MKHHVLGWGAIALATSCVDPLPSESVLDGLRVLAMRAEPPWLAPGDSATLDALVFVPDDGDRTYHWSWCPVRGGPDDGFACAITENELADQLANAGIEGVALSYDLGAEPTASLSLPDVPLLAEAMCVLVDGGDENLPCTTVTLSVELRVQHGGEEARALKSVVISFDDQLTNENPAVLGISYGEVGVDETAATAIPEGPATITLAGGESFDVVLALADDAAEPTGQPAPENEEPQVETLTLTWLVSAGSLAKPQSDSTQLDSDDAYRRNTWTVPLADEVTSTPRLFVVARDGRSGVGWLERSVGISPLAEP